MQYTSAAPCNRHSPRCPTAFRCPLPLPHCSAPSALDSLAAHLTTQLFFLGDAAEQLANSVGGSDAAQAVSDAVNAAGDATVQVRLRSHPQSSLRTAVLIAGWSGTLSMRRGQQQWQQCLEHGAPADARPPPACASLPARAATCARQPPAQEPATLGHCMLAKCDTAVA